MALLKKYKPSAAVRAEEIARLSYEDLVGQADEAIASHEWARAITLLTVAIRKADPAKNIDKANMARYNLSFCYYMNKQFYEAAVLAEHYARRYPQGGAGQVDRDWNAIMGRRLLGVRRGQVIRHSRTT